MLESGGCRRRWSDEEEGCVGWGGTRDLLRGALVLVLALMIEKL